jgi:hypothetical protein
MAVPEKTSQFRAAVGFTGLIVKNDADGADGSLLGGHISHEGMITPPGASTAAAGSTSADAATLPAGTSSVYPTTGADGTKGVKINGADKVSGKMIWVLNTVAASALKVYPPAGGTINGGSADAAVVSAAGRGICIVCLSASGNTWATL